MGLILPTYETRSGLNLTNAYMGLANIWFNHADLQIGFKMSIYLNKDAYINHKDPVEDYAAEGSMFIESLDGMDITGLIDNALIDKIAVVVEHSDQECIEHNNTISNYNNANYWLEYWDINLRKFIDAYIDLPNYETNNEKQ